MIPKLATDFPYADTRAALMLKSALERAHRERRLSIRSLGKLLNYKQATVLSHMATGRVPIPLDKAVAIARVTEMQPAAFLAACVEQRAPEAAEIFRLSAPPGESLTSTGFVTELDLIAERSLDELNDEQKSVLREVVRDPSPSRRWLSLAELPVVSMLRQARPELSKAGLTQHDKDAIRDALQK